MIIRCSYEPACSYLYINGSENEGGIREALLVDACCGAGTVRSVLQSHSAVLKYIVLTHGHYDHVVTLRELQDAFPGAETLCHKFENGTLMDVDANVSGLFGDPQTFPPCVKTLSEGDEIVLHGKKDAALTILHTPGHTPGCICLFSKEENILFTGDTLFAGGGVGRTDFKGGNGRQMSASLERLSGFDPNTVFFPGHGRSGTIGEELSWF